MQKTYPSTDTKKPSKTNSCVCVCVCVMFINRSHLSNGAEVKALTGGFGLLGWVPCSLEEIRQLSDELLLPCSVHTEHRRTSRSLQNIEKCLPDSTASYPKRRQLSR
jgi:hypothetical protein